MRHLALLLCLFLVIEAAGPSAQTGRRRSLKSAIVTVPALAGQATQRARPVPAPDPLNQLAQDYLWPASEPAFSQAATKLKNDASLVGVSRERFEDAEEAMRKGRTEISAAPASVDGKIPLQQISVPLPGGATMPVLVQLPSHYNANTDWPLMFAMHGGPPATLQQAIQGSQRMISVWSDAAESAGWIVAAPALVTSVTAGKRTQERLPYEVLHSEQLKVVLNALRLRYRIDPSRIVSTGISLGSNYSLSFGCAHPDWFLAVVPVSTEGDYRELLVRNLMNLPVYILEGALDKNIRNIAEPRALREMMASFDYDLQYREFPNRIHEGFQEHYADVLQWLDNQSRAVYPRTVLRVPNSAIRPVSKRLYWIEADTRQALIRAQVTTPTTVDITARWSRKIKVYLHDRLVDLDKPIEIRVNGIKVFSGIVPRSIPFAFEEARTLNDERRIYASAVTVDVPTTEASIAAGEKLWQELKPTRPEGKLSFWEFFATGSLEERFPSVGFEGTEEKVPKTAGLSGEEVGIRVTKVDSGGPMASSGLRVGDVVLDVDGEPFFRGQGGVSTLRQWIMRDLRSNPTDYPITVWRNGQRVSLVARLMLGPYKEGHE